MKATTIDKLGERFPWGRRTYVMGIINLTPDSFSGDGLAGFTQQAIEQAVAFQQAGADILDIGAFSTRPGHEGVSECEELERLIPTLDEIVDSVNIPISVDTFRASVARAALKSGVSLINDVTGLKSDPDLAKVAADGNAGLVVMHSQDNTSYRDLVPDIIASLEMSVRKAVSLGMNKTNLILDLSLIHI